MNYEEYVKLQIGSPVKKPWKARDGQRKAIDWFFLHVYKGVHILDVGCALGTGMVHLQNLGFKNLVGTELHPKKVEICKRRGLDVKNEDIETLYPFKKWFDVIWASHVFEHLLNPDETMHNLLEITQKDALFFFVLPYPDIEPAAAHCSSTEIGLSIDDDGSTLIQWFESNGLEFIHKKFDNYREPEIWLQFRKR